MRRLAYHDSLTGLPNRSLFTDRAQQALVQAGRSGQRVAVLFIDLDRFKQINDSLGHEVGDIFLKGVASRIAAAIRQSDTVARMGGDEFVVLAQQVNGVEDVRRIAGKIIGSLDLYALTLSEKLQRTLTRVAQAMATALFLPF